MNSRTMEPFWQVYAQLPVEVQRQAQRAFARFAHDPTHPSLRFKQVNARRHVWSARVNDDVRVLGFRGAAEMTWFWIGSHAEYGRVLARLR